MMMDNENKELSRSRKRKIERKIRIDERMKSFLIGIKTEKKKNYKNIKKIKNSKTELVKINYADKPGKLKCFKRIK